MKSLFILLFFAAILVLGFFSYQSYGISWDEPAQHSIGMLTYNYVSGKDHQLLSDPNRFYNLNIELLLYLPEKWFNLQGSQVYLARHIGTYFFFWLGTIFLFLLAKKLFRSTGYGIVAVMVLMLTPRIFAHAFINSKDIPLMSFFTVSIYAIICFLERPALKTSLLCALAVGFTMAIRPTGILLFFLAIAFFLLLVYLKKNGSTKMWLLLPFVAVTILSYYIFQPSLWENPVSGFEEGWQMMSHFPFKADTFFMGEMYAPGKLPWYYVPVWIGITVPVLWIAFFMAGIFFFIFQFTKSKQRLTESWKWLLILCWLLMPWLAVLVLHSIIYDEWRHLFFIYPAFVLLAVLGIKSIAEWLGSCGPKIKYGWLVVPGLYSCFMAGWMISNHPYENVFFNGIEGSDACKKYELDYWGTSYRQALEYLVEHDSSSVLKVSWQNDPCEWNLNWLTPEQRNRVHQVPFDSCTYFITNYRLHPELFQSSQPKFFSIKICGNEIMTIFKVYPKRAGN